MAQGDGFDIEPESSGIPVSALPNAGVAPGDYTSPDITVDAKGRVIGAISRTRGSSQMLAQMRSGTWYPGDYIGPAGTDGSTGPRGCGLWRSTHNQLLSTLGITTQLAPVSDLDLELYRLAADGSSALATGITLRLPAGENEAVNADVSYWADEGCLLAWRNVTVAGSPETLFSTQITAQSLQQ